MSGGDTIRICGTGCVLIGPEGRTPPLRFITVDADEGRALIAQALAAEVAGEGEAPEPEGTDTDTDTDTGTGGNADEGEDSDTDTDANTGGGDDVNAGGAPEEGGAEGATRADLITEALDLMEAGDLVKTGERAGKPKVDAMAAATGLADITADEIDAAIAAKDAAE